MVNNLARARARKAAMNWADWEAPKEAEGDTIRGTRVEAFEAGAAWCYDQAARPLTLGEVNEIIASLIRDAQVAGGDAAADDAAQRIAAYLGAIHGAEQDDWALERATGQRQLDEAAALIREAGEHIRSVCGTDERPHSDSGDLVARLESWLAGDQIDPDAATGCADDQGLLGTVLDLASLEAGKAYLDRSAPLFLPPAPAHSRAPDDLTAAIAGAGLIEEGAGWVKVHGLRDSRALFDVLAEANARASGAAAWRKEGNADLAAFRITTGDPRFDPGAPVTINGFRYQPTKED